MPAVSTDGVSHGRPGADDARADTGGGDHAKDVFPNCLAQVPELRGVQAEGWKRFVSTFPSFEYEGVRRIIYGDEGMMFIPVCETCGRFVKADESISVWQVKSGSPTATCTKCGRTTMPFEGYL